ncbi:helix-turn-helix transcriptional regulator [Streptomyces sp. NPDC001920]
MSALFVPPTRACQAGRWGFALPTVTAETYDAFWGPGPGAGALTGVTLVVLRQTNAPWPVAGCGMALGASLSAGADTLILCLPRAAVPDALRWQTGEPPAALRFTPVLRFASALADGDLAKAVCSGTARVFARITAPPLAPRSPLPGTHSEQALAHDLQDLQRHDHSTARPTHDHSTAHPSQARPAPLCAVRRAMAHCERHAGEPVSVADIAAAARVSPRTLQDRFRTELGTTPSAYLRRVRLDRAHQDLLRIADGSASGTVADVATRWGFTHLSRFAAYYREAYGQVPSHTARRPQSPPARGVLSALS